MNKSIYEIEMAQILKKAKVKFKEQHKFHPKRKWTFDFALLPLKVKIALEINGGSWIGGRHSRGTQYEKDLEKINMAQLMGWIVLQYTPNTIPKVLDDLKFLKTIK